MSLTQSIGILTRGGDCPGLNAVIRAAARSAELASPFALPDAIRTATPDTKRLAKTGRRRPAAVRPR